ncbi:FAD-dependent oxidoreductase [Tumidithrix elongata RA019]|uniref:FAD-dependent oxidoreductase n=1 Tax=Tumidithrix elongata BACA0141 TaxID=2716417 RepID=A0AAW9PY98_9CYAN|nr:FAD-dependent oxidoreductase [Tumidithrix elongata RA019]
MAVDYDLAIVGNGANALELARRAAKLKARVALVTEPQALSQSRLQQIATQMRKSSAGWKKDVIRGEVSFAAFLRQVLAILAPQSELEALQALGVDVIVGSGQFVNARTYAVGKRQLRSRTYAIVTDPPVSTRKIVGLEQSNYLTYETLFQLDRLPESLAIVGGDVYSCTIAQSLIHLGVTVTLLCDSSHILPDVDVEAARLLQAKLEVDGIEIYTSTRVTAISPLETTTEKNGQGTFRQKVWAGERTFECDLVLMPFFSAPLQLNLEAAKVKFQGEAIAVNAKAQTSNPRIYACYASADITKILRHSLFWTLMPPAQPAIAPIISKTLPQLAHLGMTEVDARLRYGKNLYALRHHYDDFGFCKLLCRQNGEIVGASIVGDCAGELIETVAIAMHTKLKIHQLAQLANISSGVISTTAAKFAEQKSASDRGKLSRLAKWFTFRRDFNI